MEKLVLDMTLKGYPGKKKKKMQRRSPSILGRGNHRGTN